jgi:glyceraldehyde-3-phosphate dehydrogenase (NADP+)
MKTYTDIINKQALINGNLVFGKHEKSLTVSDKYSGASLADIPLISAEQMEEALQSATQASAALRKMSAGAKSKGLQALADLLRKDAEAYAQLIAAEAGKPIGYARNEIARCLVTLETAVGEALRFSGEVVPIDYNNGEGKTAFTKRFPVGPIACISPFNFPLNLALHKIAPALAVGCPVVLKPAPQAPLTTLAFAALAHQTGLWPAGALNIFMADIPEAEKMVRDERVKMLSFTGSPQIGWHLKNIAGKKKIALELGGNAAVIVDEDAPLESTANMVATGAFLYAGQICISTQRIYVHARIFDAFSQILAQKVNALKVGDPRDETVTVGPIIDKGHMQRISDWIDEALAGGARVLAGGKIIDAHQALYAPTLLTNTQPHMKVCAQEAFGPVAILEKVENFEEAISRTNNSVFGLQAGVFTNRIDHMRMAHEMLEVGGVLINNIPGFRMDSMPYGGVKESGLGREGIRYAMEEMTEPRLLIY